MELVIIDAQLKEPNSLRSGGHEKREIRNVKRGDDPVLPGIRKGPAWEAGVNSRGGQGWQRDGDGGCTGGGTELFKEPINLENESTSAGV